MTESLQDHAALFALGLLDSEEARNFEQATARDDGLRALVADLHHTTAELARIVDPVRPPAQIKSRVMAAIGNQSVKKAVPRRTVWASLGWGIAAALAAGAFTLWTQRNQLAQRVDALTQSENTARVKLSMSEYTNKTLTGENSRSQSRIAQLDGELATLRKRDALASMEIATLQSSVAAYKQGVAVVVWDSEKLQGVLKLEKMPPIDAGKDYQLWVVDPKKPAPVNAGVVRVDEKGFARIDFKPVDAVSSAAKFALSVEREGGVAQNEGPIVLIGP